MRSNSAKPHQGKIKRCAFFHRRPSPASRAAAKVAAKQESRGGTKKNPALERESLAGYCVRLLSYDREVSNPS